MPNSISVLNGNVLFLAQLLDEPQHGDRARAKSRFLRIISPRVTEIEAERIKLLEQYADKDKEGNAIQGYGSYKVSEKNLNVFQKEYTKYLNEEFIIDILPSTAKDIRTVKDLLAESKRPLTTQEGVVYDIILTAFENALQDGVRIKD